MDPEQSDQGPHCLSVCKNRFEKFARIFSRRHKQMTFSDAVFRGILRVNADSFSEGLSSSLNIIIVSSGIPVLKSLGQTQHMP